jgi:hypothetical protein
MPSPAAVAVSAADGKLYKVGNENAHFHGFSVGSEETIEPPGICTVISHGLLRSTDWTDIAGTQFLEPDRSYFLTNVPGKISLLPVTGNLVNAGHALTTTDLLVILIPYHTVLPLYAMVWSQALDVVPVVSNAITVIQTNHRVTATGTQLERTLQTIAGGFAGSLLILSKDATSSGDVIIDDAAGNIRCAGNFTLTHPDDKIGFLFDGTNWCELFRSNNSA